MKINRPWMHQVGGLLSTPLIRGWMSSLDYRVAFYDPTLDPAYGGHRGRKIYVFWHEYMLLPLFLRGHNNLAILLSRHRDAEMLRHAARHFGFDVVRGSTRRGGVAALRELVEKSEQMNLAITPDGPRGPRRSLAQGPVYLASRLGIPLVAAGLGFDRPWRAPTWDRFAVPRPWSRARAIVSPELRIPADLGRDGVEHYRRQVERLLNRLTSEAEDWAESGVRRRDEMPLRRKHYRRPPFRLRHAA